jgi:catechol 2,3-dioxygenase-like lactoylglutathione lyase family enzyme
VKATKEVIFRAPDLRSVKHYYFERLGLPIVLEKSDMIGFTAGALNLYFERGEPNGAVFELTVDDVAQTKAKLIAAGCEILEENPAIPRIYVRDPFGVVFNITDEDPER